MTDVLKTISEFLSIHRYETVIMGWQLGTGDSILGWDLNTPDIHDWDALNTIFRNDKFIFKGNMGNSLVRTPKLGDVRGKIVLLNCIGYLKECPVSFGSKAFVTKFSGSGHTMTVHNEWNAVVEEADDVNPYVESLISHVRKSGQMAIQDKFYMTFASYSLPSSEYRETVYEKFNAELLDLAMEEKPIYGTGIVVYDFPKESYIFNVINFNFQGSFNVSMTI